MDFRPTDDQRAVRNGLRDLLARRFPREELRAALERGTLDRGLWRALGDAGLFALRLPEAEGGVGLGLPEAVLLFEEAGRALLPGPLVDTHLAAGTVKGAAEGEVVVTAQVGELIPHFADADVVRDLEREALARTVRPVRTVDPLTPLHRVPAGAAAPPEPSAESILLTAAEQAGSAARTVELAVQHARTREQFGQAVGAFQAVKHLCAQMLVRSEMARTAVHAAAVTGAGAEIAAAKLLADEAAEHNARDCLQVCGGMGFTWESDVHLHLKRAWVRAARGPSRARLERELADALLTEPAGQPADQV
ncbi:acyl-CoA dehydrogenase family protein [Streptomyces sp. NPDC004111]|uniref:acyl-CoA dehydrogenase family protein n=1 Tax=Streptomyces sp. NPDC004111 TaxID=3364690 RepID=UPI00367EE1C6